MLETARLFAVEIPRAEDSVGVAFQKGLEEARILGRVVFEVGILNDGEVAVGELDGGTDGGAFAAIPGMAIEADLGERGGQALQDGVGAIRGAIVHDDELAFHVLRQRRGEHTRDAAFDNGALVVDRHEDGELHGKYQDIKGRAGRA